MEIVYCIDANVLDQFRRSAASVMHHNPRAHITVISPEKLDIEYDNLIRKLPDIQYRHTPGDRLTDAAYMRLFLPDWLPGQSKVLYLDADTLCTGPLDELYRQRVPYIGAVHSHNYGRTQAKQIGIEQYALDSVLLLNLKALRQIGYAKNAVFALSHAQFPHTHWYCAETLLNCVFYQLITFLPLRWNYCINRNYDQYPDAIAESEAVILHFIGPDKSPQEKYFRRLFPAEK